MIKRDIEIGQFFQLYDLDHLVNFNQQFFRNWEISLGWGNK